MILSQTARTTDQHHLEIGGCDTVALVREFGTPLYVYDDLHLRTRAEEIRTAFQSRWSNTLPLYATKAFFSPYLARICRDAGLGIDITSEGELAVARRVNYAPDRIYVHGNNKTAAEIDAALGMGVNHIVVDNLDEIELLAQRAAAHHMRPRVLLRLAPAIDPHTHRYLATGVAESKFGLPLVTGDAIVAARRVVAQSEHLELVGLHVHIGSQIFDLEPYREAMQLIFDFAHELQDLVGFKLQELDLGGGWGVAYNAEQETVDPNIVAETLVGIAKTAGNPDLRLLVEPGRALVAQAAVALYTVGAIKPVGDVRTYVSVNGGMGDNIRPALYGAQYTALVANKMDAPAARRVAIAGRYCEQGDVLIGAVDLPEVVPGDLIAIPAAGAYQLPMASNYNMIPRPAIVAVRDGQAHLVRRRETIEDLLRCEVDD